LPRRETRAQVPLEPYEQWLLDLVAAEPDLTLDEIGTRLASAKRLKVGRTSIWRFYERHRITFKKTLHAAEQDRPDVGTQGKRTQHGKPHGVVSNDQPEAREGLGALGWRRGS
jgi:transposase